MGYEVDPIALSMASRALEGATESLRTSTEAEMDSIGVIDVGVSADIIKSSIVALRDLAGDVADRASEYADALVMAGRRYQEGECAARDDLLLILRGIL